MNKIFNIKRTKMVDEAAFNHKPTMLGRSILCFFLVFSIATLASNLLTNMPIVYMAINSIEGEVISTEELLNAITEMSLDSLPWWISLLTLFSKAFFIVAPIIFSMKLEKRSVFSMGIRKKGVALEILLGLGIGGVMVALAFLVNLLVGSMSFEFKGFSPIILIYFVGFMVASLGEELLVRGYFMTSLARDVRPFSAIIISALVFALFNLSTVFNLVSFLNTFLFGIFLGIFVFKRGSIWGSFAIKLVWGFGSACILGAPAYYLTMPSLFKTTYNNVQIVSGSDVYGFESGIVLTVMLIALVGISLLLKTKKSEESEINIDYFK